MKYRVTFYHIADGVYDIDDATSEDEALLLALEYEAKGFYDVEEIEEDDEDD